jgi:prepilin-type N-terminal cleavage/methylation domain-containing protein
MGFSLIELVLVISLLGILAFSVVTITFDTTTSHLTVAAKKIQSDILYARSLAMTRRGVTFGVAFTDATDTYVVYETSTATPVLSPVNRQPMNEDFAKFPGVTITGGNYTVEFNRKGAPSAGGGGSVQITNGTTTKTISVVANTGRVVIN